MNYFIIKVRNFIFKIGVYLNLLLAFLLLVTYLAVYLSPEKFPFLAFLGLIYPIILLVNLFFIIYWIIKKRWLFLISMITILAGLNHVNHLFPVNVFNKKISDKKSVSILSYNVRLFNLYEWNTNKNARTDIFNFLKKSGADIICLQEYFSKDDDSLSNTFELAKILNQNYLQIDYVKNGNKIYNFGIATYSSYPIVNRGVIKFDNSRNNGIYSDIKINKDTFRVYNFHLASVHLGYHDYYFIDNFTTRSKEERVKGFSQIISKLKKAFMKRAVQVEVVNEHIKKSPYPVIICGDFNDTPVSYTYHEMSEILTDAFVESGFGFGNTFTNSYPFFRIDYILHSKTIKSKDFQLHDLDYSDHFPISCKVVLE